jgi:DNA excision repair protein ERCC-2
VSAVDPLRFFPKPEPYDAQQEAMERIATALDERRDVLFEGACGTGKTLAALAPALAFARAEDKTVVITTNVHQQTAQFIEEAREIDAEEPIRSVVFRGKGSMCHIGVDYEECQVLRDNTYDLVEAEEEAAALADRADELLDRAQAGDEEATEARAAVMDELESTREDIEELGEANVCDRYRENLRGDNEAFYEWLHGGVRTPDEIYEYAEGRGLCGYELLKEGMEEVDLAVCNYNHLLDPTIREQFFRWLGRDPEDVVVVFDEAHNVAAAAREHGSRSLAEPTFDSAVEELEESGDPRAGRALNAVRAFRDALVETYETAVGGPGERVGAEWEDVPVRNDDRRDDLTLAFLDRYTGSGIDGDLEAALELGAELDEEYEAAYRRGESDSREECPTLQAAGFVAEYVENSGTASHHPVAGVRRREDTGEVYGRAELYACIPRPVTGDLFESVHASVLMSATLQPFAVTEETLGLGGSETETMAFGLPFPEENRRTLAVDTPPLFASERNDPDVQDVVADALADTVEYTPGNALLFFPSYAEAERYHGLLAERVDTDLYRDRPGERADALREEFVADEDAALLTSLWGTLTEGVSFDGDDARSVAVVGVPYPRIDDRAEAVQDAYGEVFGGEDAGWRYAIEVPTVRKTRQALGRVVRGPEEIGVRVLLDRRYTFGARADLGEYSVHDSFPGAEREEIVDVDPAKLRYAMLNFYTDHGAWGGDPPAP